MLQNAARDQQLGQKAKVTTVTIAKCPHGTVVAIALIALLWGCGGGQKHHSNVKSKQLSPEQLACFNRVTTGHMAQSAEFAKRQADALKEQRSTIELILLERRMTEEMCMEETKCYGITEPMFSLLFDSCITSRERDSG